MSALLSKIEPWISRMVVCGLTFHERRRNETLNNPENDVITVVRRTPQVLQVVSEATRGTSRRRVKGICNSCPLFLIVSDGWNSIGILLPMIDSCFENDFYDVDKAGKLWNKVAPRGALIRIAHYRVVSSMEASGHHHYSHLQNELGSVCLQCESSSCVVAGDANTDGKRERDGITIVDSVESCIQIIGCDGMQIVGDPEDVHDCVEVRRAFDLIPEIQTTPRLLACYLHICNLFHAEKNMKDNDGGKDYVRKSTPQKRRRRRKRNRSSIGTEPHANKTNTNTVATQEQQILGDLHTLFSTDLGLRNQSKTPITPSKNDFLLDDILKAAATISCSTKTNEGNISRHEHCITKPSIGEFSKYTLSNNCLQQPPSRTPDRPRPINPYIKRNKNSFHQYSSGKPENTFNIESQLKNNCGGSSGDDYDDFIAIDEMLASQESISPSDQSNNENLTIPDRVIDHKCSSYNPKENIEESNISCHDPNTQNEILSQPKSYKYKSPSKPHTPQELNSLNHPEISFPDSHCKEPPNHPPFEIQTKPLASKECNSHTNSSSDFNFLLENNHNEKTFHPNEKDHNPTSEEINPEKKNALFYLTSPQNDFAGESCKMKNMLFYDTEDHDEFNEESQDYYTEDHDVFDEESQDYFSTQGNEIQSSHHTSPSIRKDSSNFELDHESQPSKLDISITFIEKGEYEYNTQESVHLQLQSPPSNSSKKSSLDLRYSDKDNKIDSQNEKQMNEILASRTPPHPRTNFVQKLLESQSSEMCLQGGSKISHSNITSIEQYRINNVQNGREIQCHRQLPSEALNQEVKIFQSHLKENCDQKSDDESHFTIGSFLTKRKRQDSKLNTYRKFEIGSWLKEKIDVDSRKKKLSLPRFSPSYSQKKHRRYNVG